MTTDEAVATLAEVGLKVAVKDGRPVLLGDRSRVTPTMLAMLRWHRETIVSRLTPKPPPPCPDVLTWRLGEGREWTRMAKDRKAPCVARGWKYANEGREAPWRELSELPPAWGFKLPEVQP